jgi:putative transposase
MPGFPHHVIQRGNRRMNVFFTDHDCRAYLAMLRESSSRHRVDIWAYCLMRNHVHVVAVPATPSALSECFAEVHVRYTRRINRREGWQGHLWQARFGSSVMDEHYALAAVRYVERNPVKAGMVTHPWDYPWSSARWHVGMTRMNPLVRNDVWLRDRVGDWRAFLASPVDKEEVSRIERDVPVSRPLGSESFVAGLERETGCTLTRGKAGRPLGAIAKAPAAASKIN